MHPTKPPLKRISVIGAGAMGAYYAAKFFDMEPGGLFIIAGGERRERIREGGLIVNGKRYTPTVLGPEEKVPPSDLVIIAVKHHHLDGAIEDMKNIIGEKTCVLSVMNGIESEERIGAVYGMDKMLYGAAVGIDAVREDNRVTYSREGTLFFGEADNRNVSSRVTTAQALLDGAKIPYEIPEDMIRILWWKFMINVGVNQVSAVLKAPYGAFQRCREARDLMESAMREVMAISEAANVALRETDIENWYSFLYTLSPKGKTSMCQDMEAGRKTEVEMFAGKVMELGRSYGVPVPINETLFRLIRVMEQESGSG